MIRPRGPAARRRQHLVPIATELKHHGWTWGEVAALLVEDGLWKDHPCPVTRRFFSDEKGRSLEEQLRKDIERVTKRRRMAISVS